MCDLKSIDEIFSLSENESTLYIEYILKEEDAIYKIDELDDELLKKILECPEDVERICLINFNTFSELDQGDLRDCLLAYNSNIRMYAAFVQNKISETQIIFQEGITFCRDNKQYAAGKTLSQNVFYQFLSNQMSLDEAPYILSQIVDFYCALQKEQLVSENDKLLLLNSL